jgi:hypothetical protein
MFDSFFSRPLWQRKIVFGLVGGLGGFAYYTFIGCYNGTCMISSNPYISTAYGMLVGVLAPARKNNPR